MDGRHRAGRRSLKNTSACDEVPIGSIRGALGAPGLPGRQHMDVGRSFVRNMLVICQLVADMGSRDVMTLHTNIHRVHNYSCFIQPLQGVRRQTQPAKVVGSSK